MRHTDAGLAIPDFPLAFGHLIPPHWDPKIAIHFAHRVGALIVTAMILATTGHVLYHHRTPRGAAASVAAAAGLAAAADHARRAHVLERTTAAHQLAARRDRRVGAGDVAGADAAGAPRAVRRGTRSASGSPRVPPRNGHLEGPRRCWSARVKT